MFHFSQKSLNRLKGVHPDLVKVAKLAITRSPIDFGISQGVRTVQEQRELWAQGRTKPGKIVTWTMNGKHLIQKGGYGHAIDVVCYSQGEVTWNERFYFEVADVMLECAKELGVNIEWGGNWKTTKDYPHFEIKEK